VVVANPVPICSNAAPAMSNDTILLFTFPAVSKKIAAAFQLGGEDRKIAQSGPVTRRVEANDGVHLAPVQHDLSPENISCATL